MILDYLIGLIGRLGNWAYLVIFMGATLESAAFLGLFVPGESLVLIAGFFSAQGQLDLDVLIAIVAIGAALGDSIGYEMGRRMGRPALEHYGRRAVLWSTSFALLGYFLGASWHSAERWVGRASAIIGGALLCILVLVWLWRWMVRHEVGIKRKFSEFLERPRVQAMRRRFSREIAFVQARLSPDSYLGLQLTVGATVLVGASWLFGGIAQDVVAGDPLAVVDADVAKWLHAHSTLALTKFMLAVTHLHGTVAISSFALVAALVLLWRRDWDWLVTLAFAIPGGMLINVMMKFAFHRARPTFENPILTLPSYSFPSGHVAGATLFYGFLAAMLVFRAKTWALRVATVLTLIAVIALVALSRMYLGVHYLSDVLAAFAETIAWLTLCLVGVHTYSRHRAEARKLGLR